MSTTPTFPPHPWRTDASGDVQTSGGLGIANEPIRPRRKLNTHAAAAYSGLARSTLEKLRVFGGGPHYIKIGRRVVYDLTDLEQWLGNHRRRSTSDNGGDIPGAIPPSKKSTGGIRAG